MPVPSTSLAPGFWSLMDQRDAVMGNNWPIVGGGPIVSGFNLRGSIGITSSEWNLSYSNGVLYAMNKVANPGSSTVYRSNDYGTNWVTGATLTGSGSAYGSSILATSATRVVAQQQAYFYLSTDSGATFTQILATSSGQNNFWKLSTDGTYGLCGGYDQNVITSNNWSSASTTTKPFGIAMSTCTLTNNGSNKFVHSGFGSSISPSAAYINASNTGTGSTTVALASNNTTVYSNPNTGLFAIFLDNNTIRFATYPSTTLTTANLTGVGTLNLYGCIAPWGDIVVCSSTTGLWLVKTSGAAPVQISAFTDFGYATSEGTDAIFVIRNNGSVYTYKP